MSMYNMVCGNNPLFGLYARALETIEPLPPVPRFRDVYTKLYGGKVQIVIYTRTGGGNRPDYQAENLALTKHQLFVADCDDDFDKTFAHFVFTCPMPFEDRMLALHNIFSRHPKGMTPGEKFKLAMGQIEPPEPLTSNELDQLNEIGASMMDELPDPSTLEIAVSDHTRLSVPKN